MEMLMTQHNGYMNNDTICIWIGYLLSRLKQKDSTTTHRGRQLTEHKVQSPNSPTQKSKCKKQKVRQQKTPQNSDGAS